MSVNVANFPTSIWDGSSVNRDSRSIDAGPDYEDWDQIVAEVIAMQGGGTPVGTGGTGVTVTQAAPQIVTTTLTVDGLSVTMTDAGAAGCHGSAPLLTFPAGNIVILGAVTDLAIVAGAGGIGDAAAVVGAVGSVATAVDNATLTSTEANIVPSTAGTLTDGAGTVKGESTAPVTLDGTSSAAVARLNFAVPDADSSASDTLSVTGTVKITWANLGDN